MAPETPHRTVIKSVRWAAEEWELVQARAAELKVPPSSYVHDVVLGVNPVRRRRRPMAQVDAEAVHHLARIGNNLNQIAKALNQGGATAPFNLSDVLAEVLDAAKRLGR